MHAGPGTQELAGGEAAAPLPPPAVVEGASAAADGPAQSLGPGAPRSLPARMHVNAVCWWWTHEVCAAGSGPCSVDLHTRALEHQVVTGFCISPSKAHVDHVGCPFLFDFSDYPAAVVLRRDQLFVQIMPMSRHCKATVSAPSASAVGGGRYQVIYKRGDDLRQDQLVVQIFSLMDRLLKRENLDLRLTPYRCRPHK